MAACGSDDLYAPTLKSGDFPGHGVAVCISGQYRGFERGARRIERLWRQNLGADLFLSTWSTTGSSISRQGNLDRALPIPLVQALPPRMTEPHAFRSIFPTMCALLLDDVPLEPDDFKVRFGLASADLVDEPLITQEIDAILKASCDVGLPKHDPAIFEASLPVNTLKMFFHIWNCDRLVREAEERRGAPYRFVVRLRPDKRLIRVVIAQCIQAVSEGTNDIVTSHPVRIGLGHGDQYAFGRRDAMRRYSDLDLAPISPDTQAVAV